MRLVYLGILFGTDIAGRRACPCAVLFYIYREWFNGCKGVTEIGRPVGAGAVIVIGIQGPKGFPALGGV